MAEEERFELSEEFSPFGHLANAWFQPLTHSSNSRSLSGSVGKFLSLPGVMFIAFSFNFTTL